MAEVAVSISQPNPTTLPDRFVTYHQAHTADFGVAGQIADGVLRMLPDKLSMLPPNCLKLKAAAAEAFRTPVRKLVQLKVSEYGLAFCLAEMCHLDQHCVHSTLCA